VVRCLVNVRASISPSKDADELPTALHAATQFGHLDVMVCLVKELGADVVREDYSGNTPLYKHLPLFTNEPLIDKRKLTHLKMYAHALLYMYTHTHTHTHTHTLSLYHTHTHTHTQTQTRNPAHTRTHTHTHTYTHVHAYTQTHAHTHTHTCLGMLLPRTGRSLQLICS
jgi:hypothetical protein